MKEHVGMSRQPGIVFLVDAVMVQDRVDFFSDREIGDHAIHEFEKLNPPLLAGRLRMNSASGDFQGGKQI